MSIVENGISDAETVDIAVKNSFGLRLASAWTVGECRYGWSRLDLEHTQLCLAVFRTFT
ncbi:hypothetical protein [Clostridium thailandense]|uniref:hypothetical protein n=1 Tax=Clostridium thailandense TaxID=2794346 RepID=UPI0028A7D286|nr:hypothetical protein [Clostridium thailandense]